MLHENDQNRIDEERIIKAFADKMACTYQICSHGAYPLDAVLKKNGKCVAFAEARKTSYPSTKYPWFIWSVQKYVHVLSFLDLLPVILVVEYTDGIFWHKIKHDRGFEIAYIDRTHTTGRTSSDNEPCVRIMNETFNRLEEAEGK